MNEVTRVRSFVQSRRGGVLTVLLGILATLIWVQLRGGSLTGSSHLTPPPPVSVHPATGVQLQASLSQPMVIQGADGKIYLDLSVTTPRSSSNPFRRVPTDTIVVLDRSGSMGEDNKWHYATQSVQSLLDRLTSQDRIALVTFDSGARIDSRLVWANQANVQLIRNIVNRLGPGASTNMGEALLRAEEIARDSASAERRRRVILLSDGHANAGIVDPSELARIAARISDRGSVVSTIGMGLGFNENLMASLADHGMGSFSYLEHLESLGNILAKELDNSRDVFADASEIRIHLPAGVELIEASSYPFTAEGRAVVIRTGQLFQDSTKRFMATLKVANHIPAEYTLGDLVLSYRVDGRSYRQNLESGGLQVACVEPERKEEVVASIDKEVFREAWIKNNLGSIMRQVGDYVRSGEQEKAQQVLHSYRDRLEEADQDVPGLKKAADRQVNELEARIDDAFQGADQKTKQNRAAKSLLDSSQRLQREVNKNQK